jgi:regulatory protein
MNVKIIKYQKLSKGKYKIYLDNKTNLILYDDLILKYNLLLTKEILTKDLNKIMQDNNYYAAYDDALKYLGKKMRSKKEMNKYLSKKYPEEIVKDTINNLTNANYLNEDNYINAYVSDQINLTNKGYYKILKELINLGLAEDKIKLVLDKISNKVWQDRIKKILTKKIKVNNHDSQTKLRSKLVYELVNLGYTENMVINELTNCSFKGDTEALNKAYTRLNNSLRRKYQGKELELQLLTKLMGLGFNYNEVKQIISTKKD